ncbi:hypothetical protein [Asticcacaulis sp. W401b]|uniref:hypothetical protein n=1 Tax=Asticcacaulis sp. W401b TaxID=3388666 RepID=UPI003970DDBA
MASVDTGRLVFMANSEIGVIVIRPIGYLSGPEFIERLFKAYETVSEPWKYNRLTDFRRFEGHLSDDDLLSIRDRWVTLADGHPYSAHVAVISLDIRATIRLPAISPFFPNETICLFTSFHEGMGWLQADDRAAYLKNLQPPEGPSRRDDGIVIS